MLAANPIMTMVTICGRKFASAAILQATLLLLLLSAKNVAKEGLATQRNINFWDEPRESCLEDFLFLFVDVSGLKEKKIYTLWQQKLLFCRGEEEEDHQKIFGKNEVAW